MKIKGMFKMKFDFAIKYFSFGYLMLLKFYFTLKF